MHFDFHRLKANVAQASDEDLLDRLTVYKEGMEPAALECIEAELRQRGVSTAEIVAHEDRRRQAGVLMEAGLPVQCSVCTRPAVGTCRGWHRLWGRVPLFPRTFPYCSEHMPRDD